jgi:sugar phosphate isomerase/epimerase
MKNIPIGLQLFSVRKTMEKDFIATLEKVAQIGYRNIEFAFFPYNDGAFEPQYEAKDLKNRLRGIGLNVVNTMVAFHEQLDWEKVMDYCSDLGSMGFCSPIFFYKSKDDVLYRSEWLNKMGEKSAEKGLEFYFHNHFMEFQKFDGKYVYDLIIQNTNPENVFFELDTYWSQRGGMNPVEVMDKLGGRLRLVHQKDIGKTANPVNLFEVIPEGTNITYDVFCPIGSVTTDFVEVGTGIMDIPAIVKKAYELDSVKYIIIEQDQTTLKELESVKIGFDALSKIMG